jgi:hypothetical protein
MSINAPAAPPADPTAPTPPRRRRWPLLAGVTAAIVIAAGVTTVAITADDDPVDPPLALVLPEDTALASCIVFDVAFLADMPVAFEGRAVEVADGQVTLDVNRWYRGGDADRATLAAAGGMVALLDGFEFVEGSDYLITATEDGTVNFCGYSGLATDDLRAAFAQAFPG